MCEITSYINEIFLKVSQQCIRTMSVNITIAKGIIPSFRAIFRVLRCQVDIGVPK